MSEARYIDSADVAKIVRAELRAAFPACKFSVRTDRYAGGSSIDVSWTDGPTPQYVESIVGRFHGKTFDGMTDMASSHDSDYNGERVHFANSYIFCRRDVSDKHWSAVAEAVAKYFGVSAPTRAQADSVRVEHVGEYFSDLVYRAMADRTRYALSAGN